MTLKISKKERVALFLILALYLCVTIFTGLHHEPWADEAQSWLISRDNNIIGIIQAVRYEGTLPFWNFILKFFQLFGLKYNYVFIIPMIFTMIGIILLFMTDAPFLCKILLPFSFYVMYQESVVARQYCLVFPAMMLLVLAYRERQSKPVRFFLSVLSVSISSSYGFMIACSFMLWEFICFMREHMRNGKGSNDRSFSRYRISFWITAVVLLITLIISIPPDDCSFGVGASRDFIKSFTEAFLFNINSTVICIIFLISFAAAIILYFRKNIIQVAVYTVPLVLYMALFYSRKWHLVYLFFLVVALMLIFRNEPEPAEKNSKKPLRIIPGVYFLILLVIQCAAGFYASYLEYNKPYSPSAAVVEFIEPYISSGSSINGLGYHPVSVQPYFDSNVFSNNPENKSYFIWNEKYTYYELSSPPADIIIAPYDGFDDPEDQYDMYGFHSFIVYKFCAIEDNCLSVYIRKDLKAEG